MINYHKTTFRIKQLSFFFQTELIVRNIYGLRHPFLYVENAFQDSDFFVKIFFFDISFFSCLGSEEPVYPFRTLAVGFFKQVPSMPRGFQVGKICFIFQTSSLNATWFSDWKYMFSNKFPQCHVVFRLEIYVLFLFSF